MYFVARRAKQYEAVQDTMLHPGPLCIPVHCRAASPVAQYSTHLYSKGNVSRTLSSLYQYCTLCVLSTTLNPGHSQTSFPNANDHHETDDTQSMMCTDSAIAVKHGPLAQCQPTLVLHRMYVDLMVPTVSTGEAVSPLHRCPAARRSQMDTDGPFPSPSRGAGCDIARVWSFVKATLRGESDLTAPHPHPPPTARHHDGRPHYQGYYHSRGFSHT